MQTPVQKAGYKIGDKFRVVNAGTGFAVGAIVELNVDDGSEQPMFKGPNSRFRLADYGRSEGAYMSLNRVRPLSFKVGDRVRVKAVSTSSHTSFAHYNKDKEGTVTSIYGGSSLDVNVKFDDGAFDWGRMQDLVDAPAKKEVVAPPAFKVGDRVRVASTEHGFDLYSLNRTGTVSRLDHTSLPVRVEFDNGLGRDWGTFEELELMTESDTTTLKQKLDAIAALVKEVRELVG